MWQKELLAQHGDFVGIITPLRKIEKNKNAYEKVQQYKGKCLKRFGKTVWQVFPKASGIKF